MKNILLLFLGLIFAAPLVNAQTNDESTLLKHGQQVPAFNFSIEKDKQANIQAYKGKIVLINLFATWCPPCRMELPRVQAEIWEKYKANPNFALFVFGREEGWEKLLPFKAANNFTFPILPDLGRKIFSLFATQSIPRNIVLDEDGKVIYQSIGYSDKDFSELLDLLQKRIKKTMP